ncbi:MAG: type II secretion system protein GspG, partial [Anaerolineales bacterium]
VVISIIGILASLTLVSYSGAQKQTRDTQRRSDLAQYRNGLENFAANNNGMYPSSAGSFRQLNTDMCGTLRPNYISSCPADPTGGSYVYRYISNGTGAVGTANASSYLLYGTLETGGYWEICSDGRSGKVTAVPTDVSCDLP